MVSVFRAVKTAIANIAASNDPKLIRENVAPAGKFDFSSAFAAVFSNIGFDLMITVCSSSLVDTTPHSHGSVRFEFRPSYGSYFSEYSSQNR